MPAETRIQTQSEVEEKMVDLPESGSFQRPGSTRKRAYDIVACSRSGMAERSID